MMTKLVIAGLAMIALGSAAQAAEKACRAEIGEQQAAELVRQCTDISTATRPPCHADNPCEMIRSEIRRGCDAARATPGGDVPGHCREEDVPDDY
jgi:hypothetical protein